MYTLTCETRQTRWHSPNPLPRTRQTRRHLPNRLPRTRRHSPSHLPSTRQTHRHSPKAIFEKNVTRLDKFSWVIGESREFGTSGHSLVVIQVKSINFILFARLIFQAWTRTTSQSKTKTTIQSFLQHLAIRARQVRLDRPDRRRPARSASSSCRGTRCRVTSAICIAPKPATWLASFAARCFETRTRSDATCGGFTRMPKTNREVKPRLIEAKKSRWCRISQNKNLLTYHMLCRRSMFKCANIRQASNLFLGIFIIGLQEHLNS